MTGMLIAGTSSDAGKSLVVTGLCRAARRRGVRVAPFKAQNMSNNSMICPDGSEIGRAQYLQALAAGVEPTSAMNPVLLKPGSDRRSHIVLRGQPAGTLESGQYATGRRQLADAAWAAYEDVASAADLVICEGAGSPAEINLRAGDYVNMGLARRFDLPVVLVGDIDRGGVLASLYGTWALLDDDDRGLLAGYIINKFRGDQAVLDPGLTEISARTGMANFGVLPWLSDVWLDGEDALAFRRWPQRESASLHVVVVPFPRLSNATDVDALASTPGVRVEATADARAAEACDLLVLPGSRATLSDLAWLRERGLDSVIAHRHAAGRPVLGVCGGYEMLARTIADDVESGLGTLPGLGVLPVDVAFGQQKVTARTTHAWQGRDVRGYEIHHGICRPDADAEPFLDGCRAGETFGTMLHGAFEDDDFRADFLAHVASVTGRPWTRPAGPGFAAQREAMIDTLADACEAHLDLDALFALAR